MEKWIAGLFGRKVVYLCDHDGEVKKHWAKQTPFGLVCNRMSLVYSRCLLLPDGRVVGPCYVEKWMPA